MPRVSTRRKRRLALGSTKQKHRFHKGLTARKRLKSFATKEKATSWAKEQKLDEKTHELRQLKTKWQWRATA